MGDFYRVSWNQLRDGAGSVQAAIGKMDSDLAEIEAAARATMATWDGESRAAYQERQAQWSSAADQIKSVLMRVKSAMESSADSAQATESRNATTLA